MRKTVRIISLCLALVFGCTFLSGCFGSSKNGPEKQVVDKVYRYKTTELALIEEPSFEEGEEFLGYTHIGQTSLSADGYVYTLESVDKDYTTESIYAYVGSYDGGEPVKIQLPVKDDEDGYRYIQSITRIPGGVLVSAFENKLIDKENYIYEDTFYLEFYGDDGTVGDSVDVKAALGISSGPDSYVSLNRIVYANGDAYVTLYTDDDRYVNKLVRLSLDGSVKDIISIAPEGEDGYIGDVKAFGENKLFIPYESYGNEYKQKIVIIDTVTGERTELDVGDNYEIMYRSFVGNDEKLYFSDEEGIYYFDTATGESTMLANFINSDYIYKYGQFYAINSEKFVALSNEYNDNVTTLELTTFEKVPDEEIVPKYLIKVASVGSSYTFRNQIVEFNLASDEYRIEYIDYSEYNTEDDYEAGKTKLNNDIIAGIIPDVLLADEEFSVAKYVSKGLFTDLYTLMDKDDTLSRDKFLDNVLLACETNGKLYELPSSIYLMGFIGMKDRISEFDGLTVRQFVDKIKALPEGTTFFRDGDYSREEMLRILFFINYVNFLNPTTGLCSLNNEDFKAMLEWTATMPEKSRWEDEKFDYETFDYEAYENMFKEGKAIAEFGSIEAFESFGNYSYSFGDADIDFIGSPAPDGDGVVFASSGLKFLVSAKGNFPEQAWEFVKVFFTDKNQKELGWGFPVTKSALENKKQETLDAIKIRQENEANADSGVSTLPEYGVDGGFIGGVFPTRVSTDVEDVERIYGLVTSVKKQMKYDDSIFDIIKEEASEFFGGKKSLDDVAFQAESRVNIKLGEQM